MCNELCHGQNRVAAVKYVELELISQIIHILQPVIRNAFHCFALLQCSFTMGRRTRRQQNGLELDDAFILCSMLQQSLLASAELILRSIQNNLFDRF